MTQKSRIALGLVCFFLFFLAATSWLSAKQNVSRSPGMNSTSPRIAVDSVGNIHVAWTENVTGTRRGDAYYAKYDIGTKTWSTPLNLSNSGRVFGDEDRAASIAIDGSDRLYVMYGERTRISLRIFSGGSWGAPILLSSWTSGDGDNTRVAVDAQGNIFTCWWIISSGTVYSRSRVNGVWENVQLISAGLSKFPDIAVGTNAVFACWTAKYNTSVYQIFYARRTTALNAQWTVPKIMYGGSLKQQVPAVEVDSNDAAHIVYTPAFDTPGQRQVRYTSWAGNGFSSPVLLSATVVLHYPAVDERGGNIYACWQTGPFGNGKRVEANNRINGIWTGVRGVPDSGGCTYCDVAVDPFGVEVYYVWDQSGEIWFGTSRGSEPPDNDPPTAEFVFSPTTGVYPAEITFDGSSSQDPDGSIASYSWDFGDGGRASGAVVKHTYELWGTFEVSLVVRDNMGATGAKTHTLEILRLFQPLNIRWEIKVDESLLQSRKVAQVTWSKNPANDDIGVQIAQYRVYRKKPGESDAAYLLCGEVAGSVYKYLDTNIGKNDVYVYTVSARDSQGHESPIAGGQASSAALEKRRASPAPIRRGRLLDRN